MSKTKWYTRALYLVFALALVAGLTIVPAVGASPDVSNVRVELSDYADNAAGVTYYVYFTPGADLTKDVDTITVFFPTGTGNIVVGNAARVDQDGDAALYGTTVVATKSVAGYRFILTTPVNITAGTEVRVEIDGINNPDITPTTQAFTLKVYTSQETEQVESSSYTIGLTKVGPTSFNPATGVPVADDGTAGLADDYLIEFTTSASGALVADWDTITVIFPPDITVPSSIAASSVAIDETAAAGTWTVCTAAPTVSGRTVTLTVPIILGGAQTIGNSEAVKVHFKAAAGIKNPTLATDANNINVPGRYVGKFYTSMDVGLQRQAFVRVIDAAPPCALGFLATSPTSVPVNTASANITVQSKDQYGNLSDVPVDVVVQLSSSSTTGTFWGDTTSNGNKTLDVGGLFDDTTTLIETAVGHEGDFQYKDTALGTATITASYPAHAWTPATWDMEVYAIGEVKLYDGTVLIGIYTTIKDALNDAAATNTIKVGPGTYSATSGETFPIINKANLTIESTDGAASTIIDATGSGVGAAVQITADGVTFKGFTVLSNTATNQKGIFISGADSVTVTNNIVTSTAGNVIGINLINNTTNATVSDNQLTDCTIYCDVVVTSCKILDNEISNGAISLGDNVTKLTIKGNTISSSPWSGIQFLDVGAGNDIDEITIEGNTITGHLASGIWFQADADATATNVLIVGNDITGNTKNGILIEDWDAGNAIKFNNISGNTDYGLKNTTATNVDATHNWWGTDVASEVAGMVSDTGAGVTSYDPWLGASVSAGAIAVNAASLDAQATVGVKVSGVAGFGATTVIGAGRYTANPKATPTFTVLENGFFDVFVKDPDAGAGTSTEVGIKFYDAAITSDCTAYMWDAFEEVWKPCTEQSTAAGMVWVKARPYSATVPALPTIGDLAGTPFAISTEVPVKVLESIDAAPDPVSLDVGGTQALTVTATYSDASTADVTADSTYVSDDETVATVSAAGVITGVAGGSATITVSYTEGGVTETDTVAVVVGWDPMVYDENGDGVISKAEAVNAVQDYFNGLITKAQAIEVVTLYFA